MAHLLDNDASGIVGAGRTFLVEESAEPTQAEAAGERQIFGRRHPMRADHGAATRVYVHNLYLVDTDTAQRERADDARIFAAKQHHVNCWQPTGSISQRSVATMSRAWW